MATLKTAASFQATPSTLVPATVTLHTLISLCWMGTRTLAHPFVHSQTCQIHPRTWFTTTLPRRGLYVLSATNDGDYGSGETTSNAVFVNGEFVFAAYSEGIISNAALALRLDAKDMIRVAPTYLHRPRNLLSVAYVDTTEAHFTAMKATDHDRLYRVGGGGVVFRLKWANHGWKAVHHPASHYRVQRGGVYWVMARSHGDKELAVRSTTTETDQEQDTESTLLFTLPKYSPNSSTSCAGAYFLPDGARVSLAPLHRDVFVRAFSLLSLLELRARGPGGSKQAFTAQPQLLSEHDCRQAKAPPVFLPSQRTHRATAHHARAARAAHPLPDAYALYWTGEIMTDHGSLAQKHGRFVQLHTPGTYLFSMRPDNAVGDVHMSFVMVKNGLTAVWAVTSENTPSGEVVALRFRHRTKLTFYLLASSTCTVRAGSLVSVALASTL